MKYDIPVIGAMVGVVIVALWPQMTNQYRAYQAQRRAQQTECMRNSAKEVAVRALQYRPEGSRVVVSAESIAKAVQSKCNAESYEDALDAAARAIIWAEQPN
jgi:hypothetical protein